MDIENKIRFEAENCIKRLREHKELKNARLEFLRACGGFIFIYAQYTKANGKVKTETIRCNGIK